MSLELDKRQRAMLREMGVRVWQPLTPVQPPSALPVTALAALTTLPEVVALTVLAVLEHPVDAIDFVAGPARDSKAPGPFDKKIAPLATLTAAASPDPLPRDADADSSAAHWHLGQAVALYTDAAPASGPRWLVLAETPASALQADRFTPFEGDAGKLLDNMLRAARLDKVGSVLLAPLVRGAASDSDMPTLLSAVIASAQPDVVLVMGRLAAQALLQSNAPFGKLRGQVHALHGLPTVVTHDAPYLLRAPLDKAKAWDDLCLALHVVSRKAAEA